MVEESMSYLYGGFFIYLFILLFWLEVVTVFYLKDL